MRLVHTHVCPALRYLLIIAPCTAESISASSNTMKGALPPSSIEVRLTVAAHCSMSSLPTCVDPVNDNLRTVGLLVISAPISRVTPATILITPAGTPARAASSVNANADRGVSLAGLQTTVHPDARAGATLRISIAFGQFHGLIQATTPTGCLTTTTRLSFDACGIVSP